MDQGLSPGQTLGILGGGQLGRFIAQAAKNLGWKTAALDPDKNSPALQIVDVPIHGSVDDISAARRLAQLSDIVTLEWELIALSTLEEIARLKPLFPAPRVLAKIQDRLIQKKFLDEYGFPQTPYGEALSIQDLPFPIILKRRTRGYDGKGQARLNSKTDAAKAFELLKEPCVWESLVSFKKEISVILARGKDGQTSVYPIAENIHRNGILHMTRAPAHITEDTALKAKTLALKIAETLGHVGVMAVEMFLLESGQLLINEIAPRVHNSGHYTLGACETSQFEQHARAVGGLPLGDCKMKAPAVMVNLLGDLWNGGKPNWSALDGVPGLTLHLYGKSEARPGRKMGHYTVVGPSAADEWKNAGERLNSLTEKSRR
jgi:5-(carboxyamino)imidazole ribonucleotide synthase